jgi:hypothetical protein
MARFKRGFAEAAGGLAFGADFDVVVMKGLLDGQ